jgi:hypothetical protein
VIGIYYIERSGSLGQEQKPRRRFGGSDLAVIGGAFGLFAIVYGAMYFFTRRPKEEF